MKKISYNFPVAILLLGFVSLAQAQEIQKMVHSPEALEALAEMKRIRTEISALNEALSKKENQVGEEATQADRPKDTTVTVSVKMLGFVPKGSVREKLFAQRDSLGERVKALRFAYNKAVLQTSASQTVLHNMQQAMEASDRETANRVKDDYIQSLQAATREKLQSKQIDQKTYDTEMACIQQVKTSLGMLGYLSALVDSPKAKDLMASREQLENQKRKIESQLAPIQDRMKLLSNELREWRRQHEGSPEDPAVADKYAKLEAERHMLYKQADSVDTYVIQPLSHQIDSLHRLYAQEITRDWATQAVLKQIHHRTDSLVKEIATLYDQYKEMAIKGEPTEAILKQVAKVKADTVRYQMKNDYIQSLRDANKEQLRLSQIDMDVSYADIVAINKMDSALEYLGFPPFQTVTVIVDRWD